MKKMAKKEKQKIFESKENALNMLAMAKSNVKLAKIGINSEGIFFETLCSQCQDAIEKSLKSLMTWNVGFYFFGHSIIELINDMEQARINLPEEIKSAALGFVTIDGGCSFPIKIPYNFSITSHSSDYSSERRYHTPNKPISKKDFKLFLERTEKIVDWVDQQMR
jgi:HEPN domain-containing protein